MPYSRIRLWTIFIFLLAFLPGCGSDDAVLTAESPQIEATTAQEILDPTPTLFEAPDSTAVPPTANPTTTPSPVPPTEAALPEAVIDVAGATVPPGFSFVHFADIYRPTGLTFDPSGRLLVTSFDGTVHILEDDDGDGRSDSDATFAGGFNTALGITVRPGTADVYVSSNGQITLLRDENRDNLAEFRQVVIDNIPTGLHQNDNLKFGPDGWLYMGVGSTCDACIEVDSRSASLMRFNVDDGTSEIVATGLRNPYDLAFHPQTGDLFATDNGRDDLGLGSPFEELNLIVEGGDYGWPNCWNDQEGPDCAGTETAVAFFQPHASANGLDFYTGSQFPADYQNSAFVTLFGTFLTDGVGTGIVRVELTPDGDSYQSTISWFARWPDARPLPLIVGPDGAIYVGDYLGDAIYRISYGP